MSNRKETIICLLTLLFVSFGPRTVIALDNAEAIGISAGEDHTLIVLEDGTAYGCGENGYYQLGIDNYTDQYVFAQVLKGEMSTGSDYIEDITEVAAGWMHSLALDEYGYVWAWGDNDEGELGDGNRGTAASTPVQVHEGEMETDSDFLEDIFTISAGRSGEHSLAVDDVDYFVWAWGNNNMGQLGNDTLEDTDTPVRVKKGEMTSSTTDFLEGILAVSAGEEHSMAVDENGYVWTWGDMG